MIDPNNLCMGCMTELSDVHEKCPKCGFSIEEYNQKRSSRALPPMTILAGKYLLGKVLGEGGFGITYLGWDLNKEEKIAVKECFPSGLVYRDTMMLEKETVTVINDRQEYFKKALESFAQEAENLQRFNQCPGIVSVRDFFYENETAYIVMEYVEGKTLKQIMDEMNGAFKYQRVLEMLKPLMETLDRIHREGIIHRDISPENIILKEDGTVTLIDFGAARIQTGNETKSMSIILKHGYAPIEQYQSRSRQGPWTDIYALCATMYHLMSGKLPVSAADRVLEDSLEPLYKVYLAVPLRISDAISKGMKIKIEDRYQSMKELEEDLFSVAKETAPRKVENDIPDQSGQTSKGSQMPQTNIGIWKYFLILAIIIAGYFVVVLPSNNTERNQKVLLYRETEIYADSSTNAKIVDTVQNSAYYTYLGTADDDGWVKVRLKGGKVGFVLERLIGTITGEKT